MTRKDFELIAGVLNRAINNPSYDNDTAQDIADSFADVLAGTNARFDKKRFLEAAGWTDPNVSVGTDVDCGCGGKFCYDCCED